MDRVKPRQGWLGGNGADAVLDEKVGRHLGSMVGDQGSAKLMEKITEDIGETRLWVSFRWNYASHIVTWYHIKMSRAEAGSGGPGATGYPTPGDFADAFKWAMAAKPLLAGDDMGFNSFFFLSKTCLDYHDLLESPIKRPVITIGDDSIRCVKKMVFESGWSPVFENPIADQQLVDTHQENLLGDVLFMGNICLSTYIAWTHVIFILVYCPMAKKSSTKLPSSRPLGPTPIWTDRFQHVDLPTVVFGK